MEKWRSKSRLPLKPDVDFPKNHNRNAARPSPPSEKKKGRKWSFGNFLKRKTKETPLKIVETSTQTSIEAINTAIYEYPAIPQETKHFEIINLHKKPQIALSSCSQDSITSRVPEEPKNSKKNRLKHRIQANREKYKGNSSSEDEFPSNLSLLRIHSEDSIQKYDSFNQKRTRGARTERYMKRLFTTGENKFPHDQNSIKSDILPPMGSPISDYRANAHRKSYSCSNSYSPMMTRFGSDCHLPNYRQRLIDSNVLHDTHQHDEVLYDVQPPEPPPRAFKLRVFPSTMRYSLQHSDIENNQNGTFDFNCNSLDRTRNCPNRPASPQKNVKWARKIEDPIIPQIRPSNPNQKSNSSIKPTPESKSIHEDLDRKRHSKNLEEALEELETIYNSLRLSDEDLLDRAEERSMEEYRDKLATNGIDGSIKSTSDTSSSTDMTREFSWRNNYEEDRLKDDMAYRRMQRPSSVDNYGSTPQMSYLASSPCLSQNGLNERPKSRRGTPDLTRDDVLFRSISHANNTLKIADPQPPFGIPLGPVTGAAESDYLHVVPHKDETYRSVYLPKREPDVVSDDLAFRSLRKDGRAQSPGNSSFLPKNFVPEMNRRAVRSLSADLYGIIKKESKQSSWYKEYVKLNRPLRVSGILEARNSVDINGNRPKIDHRGIPQGSDNEGIIENKCAETGGKAIPSFTDAEVSEYKELCRELENLIKKTSERVKVKGKGEERSSLTEFVEWEEILGKNQVVDDVGDAESHEGVKESVKSIDLQRTDEDVGKTTNLSNEPVPHIFISEASSMLNLKDGSNDDETNDVEAKFENSNVTSDDKISSDNKLNEGINLTSMIEGNKNGDLITSIMNFCFVTNCLGAYSVALWSMCLTLLIAIIVAL